MEVFNFLNFFQIFSLIKIGYLIVNLMFVIFLIVVIRQVFSMNIIINDSNDSLILKFGVLALFAIAISLFVATLVIL